MPFKHKNILLIPLIAIVLALAWAKPLDVRAEQNVTAGFQRALTTFAVARTLNAVLSTVQSASVNVGVGVGAAIRPGAFLKPIDELTEQLSTVMLFATASFAAQRMLLEIFGTWPVSALLTVALAAWFACFWRLRYVPQWLPRIMLVLICLRFAVPALALLSEATHQALLARDYEVSTTALEGIELPDTLTERGESTTEKIKHVWSQLENLKAKADGLAEHMVKLVAVFVVQTVVLPLVFLAFLLWLYRTTFSVPSRPTAARLDLRGGILP